MVAGNETSSNALTWLLYLLATHPEHAGRIQEEVDTHLGDGPISAEGLVRLSVGSPGARHLGGRWFDLEVAALRESGDFRNQERRNRFDAPVVLAHIAVEEAPGGLEPVLGCDEFVLKVEKCSARPQLGIRLADRQKVTEFDRQDVLDALMGLGSARNACCASAGFGHVAERVRLVGCVSPYGLDEIGDQLVTSRELRLDVRPGVVECLALRDEAVEGHRCPGDDNNENSQDRNGHVL